MDAKRNAVIQAAKAVGTPRVKQQPLPLHPDAATWEHWITKYREQIARTINNPYPKDLAAYAAALDFLTLEMGESPRERAVVKEASKMLYRAARRFRTDELENIQVILRGAVSKLQSIE